MSAAVCGAGEGVLLTREFCVDSALEKARSAGRLDCQARMAQTGVDQARARSLPRLNAKGGARYEFRSEETIGEVEGDFGETLFEIPQNQARRRVAQGAAVVGMLLDARESAAVAAAGARSWLDFLRADLKLALAEERWLAAARAADAWAGLGDFEELKARRLEAFESFVREDMELEAAKTEYALARERLFAVCGLDTKAFLYWEMPSDYAAPVVPLERCVEWALAHRGDLLAAREKQAMLRQARRLAAMGRLPTPGVNFGYRSSGVSDTDEAEKGWYAHAFVRIPIWDAGDISAQVRRAEIEAEQAVLEEDALRHKVAAEVALAHAAWRKARESLRIYSGAGTAAEISARAEARYATGDISSSELEHERVRALELELRRFELVLECFKAETDLLEAMNVQGAQWPRELVAE